MAIVAPTLGNRVTRKVALSLDDETVTTLDELAERGYDGNRSAVMRALVLLHAGDLAGALAEAVPQEKHPSYEPGHWEKRRLSFELVRQVAAVCRTGSTADAAFDFAGVTKVQRSRWMLQGRKDQQEGKASVYADLVAGITKARAEAEIEDVERIRRAGVTAYQALLSRLERQEPDRWGQRKRVDGHITHSALPAIDFERLDVGETKELVRLLRKASPDPGETRLGRGVRPVGELLPGDVLEGEIVDEEEPEDVEASPVEKPDA